MVLLERQPFLDELAHRRQLADQGRGQVIFVSGEAGIGKTSLVNEFLGATPALRGYCDALATPHALAPVIEVWSQMTGLDLSAAPTREQLFPGLWSRIQEGDGLVSIVLEDLHWADEATIDFVRYLSRRITHARCLLLATLREDEIGPSHPLRRAMGDLTGEHIARVRLNALSESAVAQLAHQLGRDGNRVFKITGGNPFFVREVLSAPLGSVPQTVRDSMLARLARCSAAAREVAEYSALSPGRIEIELVTELRGTSHNAIDECIERGILTHERGALAYRHELARRAVEDSLPPARAQEWHGRILEILRKRDSEIGRIVHHARGGRNAQAVLAYAPVAAKRASAVGAHCEAAANYAAALEFAADLSMEERARLRERHAYECYLTSEIETAVESAKHALEIWRELGDRQAEGRMLRLLSRLFWFLGNQRMAQQHASAALAVHEQFPPDRDLAMAYSNCAQLAMNADDIRESVEFGERAVAIARSVNDVEIEVHALNNIGAALMPQDYEAGKAALERSLRLALDNDLHEHIARAHVNRVSIAVKLQEVENGRAYLKEGIAYTEERDLDSWGIYLQIVQARFDCDRGDWTRAERNAAHFLEDPVAVAIMRIPALVVCGTVRMRRGVEGADALLDEALRRALPTGELQRMGPISAARAEQAWHRGDLETVAREADVGLGYVNGRRDVWLKGELLFWKSRAVPVVPPEDIAPAYRFAIEGNWRAAADEFERHQLPYEQALMLLDGDEAALEAAQAIIVRLGAEVLRKRWEEAMRARSKKGRRSAQTNPHGLTNREIEVLQLLGSGYTNAELARRLFVSAKTVDHHVSAILGKLQVRSRAHAVTAAYELGIMKRD